MQTRTRDAVLGAIGFAALACYVLACGPAFSPDDSRVLFPSNDPATGRIVMALYDRRTRTTRTLLKLPIGSDDPVAAYAWTGDGQQALALWAGKHDELHIAAIPLRAGAAPQLSSIGDFDSDDGMNLYWHPVIVADALYVGGDDALRRIDLHSGAVSSASVPGELRLAAQDGRVYYARKLPDEDTAADRVEVGEVDLPSLKLLPQFVASGAGSDVFAVSRDGRRIALDASGSDAAQLLIYSDGTLRRTLNVAATSADLEIAGMPEFSRDGSRLYATFRQPLAESRYTYGVIELPVDGGAPRRQPLLTAGDKSGLLPLQISHDGRTLAVVSTYLQTPAADLAEGKPPGLEARGLALYLVDLAGARHAVTKVAIPPLPVPAAPLPRPGPPAPAEPRPSAEPPSSAGSPREP